MYSIELVALDLENAASWRRRCAERFPDDAARNLQAADALDRLASEVRKPQCSELHAEVAKLSREDRNDCFAAALSELARGIGFRANVNSGRELLTLLRDLCA